MHKNLALEAMCSNNSANASSNAVIIVHMIIVQCIQIKVVCLCPKLRLYAYV